MIENLKSVEQRKDLRNLSENFIVAERREQIFYRRMNVTSYFWNMCQGGENDYIEKEIID
jgi:hypothetical protein